MSREPTTLGPEFEREAKEAARTCWVCHRQGKSVESMQAHREKAHPDRAKLAVRGYWS